MRKNQIVKLGKALEGTPPATVAITMQLLVDRYVVEQAYVNGVSGSNALFDAIKDGIDGAKLIAFHL